MHEEEIYVAMPINDYRKDDEPLKVIEEQPIYKENIAEQAEAIVNEVTTTPETTDQTYIQWIIFNNIRKRVY